MDHAGGGMSALTQGMGIGFAIAAPVGPIGMLCIRRSVHDGAAIGLATGLGAALADGCYGLMVAGGLAVTGWLTAHALALNLIGMLVLGWMGYGALKAFAAKSRPGQVISAEGDGGGGSQGAQVLPAHRGLDVFKALASTFVLTLSNPATIISFVGVVSAFAAGSDADPYWFVIGVFCGSMLWWTLLVAGVTWLGRATGLATTPARLRWIDLATGLVLLGFAAWIGARLWAQA